MKRFNDFYRRILAYAFDFLLIQLFASILVDSSVINFQYKEYTKLYDEYESNYTEYYKYKDINIKDCSDLDSLIKDKKIDDEEITRAYAEISDDDQCKELINTINEKKIPKDVFEKKTNRLYYKLQRLSTFKYTVLIILTYLYFVLFQGFTKGKTLGKKIMRVKVTSLIGKDVTYKQLAIRTLFLGNVIYNALNALFPWLLDQATYVSIGNEIYLFNNVFYIVMVVVAYTNKETMGIHDMLAKTKVIIDEKEKK